MAIEYSVRCALGASQDLYHLSRIHTALCDLESAGRIDFEFVSPQKTEHSREARVLLEVEQRGSRCRIALDLMDRSNEFCPVLLRDSDIYFKRSYYAPDVADPKVRPFGLNYAARSARQTWRVLSRLGAQWLAAGLKDFRTELRRFRQFQVIPTAPAFERRPDEPGEVRILFQTRLWDPQQVAFDELDKINQERIDMVRALGRAFPQDFIGGLVPEPYAAAHYPDLLATQAHRHHDFIAFSRTKAIGVYTRGVHDSDAFKLPEYIASSKAIVMTPSRNQFPKPFESYLPYATVDQCVAQCDRLLTDSNLRRELAAESWKYYTSELAPAQQMMRTLDRAFEKV